MQDKNNSTTKTGVYINLRGEEYEAMIPGTKCPVSAGVLEQWYWKDFLSIERIKDKMLLDYQVVMSITYIKELFSKNNIRIRTRKESLVLRIKRDPDSIKNFCTSGQRSGLPKDQMREIQKLGLAKRNENRKADGYVEKKCPVCSCVFTVFKCKQDRVCCSKSCANKKRWSERRIALFNRGLFCSKCGGVLTFGKSYEKFKQFHCLECKASTRRPIIELGLRQDLEEAGAIDDGRILASAFKPKNKE